MTVELTFQSIDKADGSGCLRTAGLVREAEISEILHVLHENPLRLVLHINRNSSRASQKLRRLSEASNSCITIS